VFSTFTKESIAEIKSLLRLPISELDCDTFYNTSSVAVLHQWYGMSGHLASLVSVVAWPHRRDEKVIDKESE
jgi:hypothetical protein